MKSDGVYRNGHKIPKKNLSWREYFQAYVFMHRRKFPNDATPYLGYEWSYTKMGAENIANNHKDQKAKIRKNAKYGVYVVYIRI
jgi:hypothetical protein